VLFGDVIGPGMTTYQWTLAEQGRPGEVPQASALVGDVTTFEFGVGDTVDALRDGTPGSELEARGRPRRRRNPTHTARRPVWGTPERRATSRAGSGSARASYS
jgi:hypothetical protein